MVFHAKNNSIQEYYLYRRILNLVFWTPFFMSSFTLNFTVNSFQIDFSWLSPKQFFSSLFDWIIEWDFLFKLGLRFFSRLITSFEDGTQECILCKAVRRRGVWVVIKSVIANWKSSNIIKSNKHILNSVESTKEMNEQYAQHTPVFDEKSLWWKIS